MAMPVPPRRNAADGRSSRQRPASWAVLCFRAETPSWLLSAAVHFAALILLALSLERPPAGAAASLSWEMGFTEGAADDPTETLPVELTVSPVNPSAADAASASSSSQPVRTLADALGGPVSVDPSGALPATPAVGGSSGESGVGDVRSAVGGARSQAVGALGGKAVVGVFGTSGEGYKFVYVFDRSGSMGGSGRNALEAAKAELLASLRALSQTHQFQIIFYNDQVTKFNPTGDPDRLVFANEQNKQAAARFLATITADGGTQHEAALSAAIRLRPDVIFFLTDADEPKLYPAQLQRIHRMANGITINTIEFGYGPRVAEDNFLVRLARENGGQHAYFDVSKLLQRRGGEDGISAAVPDAPSQLSAPAAHPIFGPSERPPRP